MMDIVSLPTDDHPGMEKCSVFIFKIDPFVT